MRQPFILILALVAVVHATLLVLTFHYAPTRNAPSQQKTQTVIKMRIDDHYRSTKRQIVESEDGDSVKDRPLDDAYLSDKNRYFNRETHARNIGKFHAGGNGGGGGGGAKGAQAKKEMSLSALGAFSQDHHPYKVASQKHSQKLEGQSRPDQSRGVSSSSDHLLNVPLGDFTHLNTVEYKYYGFYHRIRQKLEQFWGRSLQEKAQAMLAMGRSIVSNDSDEHITSLEVSMSPEGEILEIVIRGTSGSRELDDAAIESFNQAGPFPNPPLGLIVNGRVTIEWGFVVKS